MSCGKVDEATVYQCTGNPDPKDVRAMLSAMLEMEYKEAYEGLLPRVVVPSLNLFLPFSCTTDKDHQRPGNS